MIARRLLTFFVLLLVVSALSAGFLAPPRAPDAGSEATPEPTPAPTRSAVVERTLHAERAPRTITVHSGDLLSLTVRAETDDAVELQGLTAIRPVAPETPVTFDVLADAPGTYPVVLIDAARTVGTVRVLSRSPE
jgi:hypothetical protein